MGPAGTTPRPAHMCWRSRRGGILRLLRTAVLLVLGAVAAACGDDDPTLPEPPDIETLVFAPELEVDIDQMTLSPAGLYYQDLVVGEGRRVNTGDGIKFHYQGWLHDGTDVDEGLYPTGQFSPGAILGADAEWYYQIGSGSTLSAWDLGLDDMRVGGTRKLVIPPKLAFGNQGSPDGRVPPNAVLVYVLEVLAAEP